MSRQPLPILHAPLRAPAAFEQRLGESGLELRRAARVEVLQVNVGKLCNEACKHCHVDAGPRRTEIMSAETADEILRAVRRFRFPTVDITGGAPELNPNFRRLVREARAAGSHVIVRHNLTVMFEAGQEDLPEFFRGHGAEVVSSLPYFLGQQTDAQRGPGVFGKSIEALRRVHASGYRVRGGGLTLKLL